MRIVRRKSDGRFIQAGSSSAEMLLKNAVNEGHVEADIEVIEYTGDVQVYINANFPKTKGELNAPILAQLRGNDEKGMRALREQVLGLADNTTRLKAINAEQVDLRSQLI